eukprot:gene20054-biopygen20573
MQKQDRCWVATRQRSQPFQEWGGARQHAGRPPPPTPITAAVSLPRPELERRDRARTRDENFLCGRGGPLGEQDSGAGVARAWRGRGAGYRQFLAWGGPGVARAWRGRGAGMSCSPWAGLSS